MPALRRLAMNLSPVPWLQLCCQAYFAVTSNTVQFGAQLFLVAEVADCGLRGQFGLDVLIHFEPSMPFTANMRGSLSVEVFGETLLGIAFDLTLEGPTPWHAAGRGSIDLFLFSASFDFDERWGSPPPPLPATPVDLGAELSKAFAQRSAWSVLPPSGAERSPVRPSPSANAKLAAGERVHPHGRLAARQHVLPFGVDVQRFGCSVVDPPQRWDVAAATLGEENARGGAVKDTFAPGQPSGGRPPGRPCGWPRNSPSRRCPPGRWPGSRPPLRGSRPPAGADGEVPVAELRRALAGRSGLRAVEAWEVRSR